MNEQTSPSAWRSQRGESAGWHARLLSGAESKYLIVSTDTHANEPMDVFSGRIEAEYQERVPRLKVDADGTQWLLTDGREPQPVKIAKGRTDLLLEPEEFETFEEMMPYTDKMDAEDVRRASSGRNVDQRYMDAAAEGVDAEIVFGQKGLLAFATNDIAFSTAMCRAWNRWAHETFGDHPKFMPMAQIAPGDVKTAIAEVQWAAANGFHGVLIPNRPVYNSLTEPRNPLEYNDKTFDPLWSAIEETGMPMVLHVSAGGDDPRAVRGRGGAITNFVCHSMATTIEPLVQIITSGVFERHPGLRLGTIESGIGWIPWLLQQMDYAYRAHHMWVRPVIPSEPSFYFKRNCFSSFIEEPDALDQAIKAGLEDNIVWSNDYPHQEGAFPHSSASIERQMANLTDAQRAKVLGLNAAKYFNIDAEKVRAKV